MPAKPVINVVLAETYYALLSGNKGGFFPDIQDLAAYKERIDRYESCCLGAAECQSPLLNRRFLWNFRANYYTQSGDYLQAEAALEKALAAEAGEAERKILTDQQIELNLLSTFMIQNDAEKVFPLLDKYFDAMLAAFSSEEDSRPMAGQSETGRLLSKEYDLLRFATLALAFFGLQVEFDLADEFLTKIRIALGRVCTEIESISSLQEIKGNWVAMFLASGILVLCRSCQDEDLIRWYRTLRYLEKECVEDDLNAAQRQSLYQAQLLAAWRLGLPEVEGYVNSLLKGLADLPVPGIVKADAYRLAAMYCADQGNSQIALQYTYQALEVLEATWHGFVRYANDQRLLDILEPVRQTFVRCYQLLRRYLGAEDAYEAVLRFKNLASLAGRERNRVLRETRMDPGLMQRIRELQDLIAMQATGDLIREQEENSAPLEEELRELERTFAEQFPSEVGFTKITLEGVWAAIPEDAVILEYYFTIDDRGKALFTEGEIEADYLIYDLFITVKDGGRAVLHRVVIPNAAEISDMAWELLSILQEMSDSERDDSRLSRLEDLREELFHRLLRPAMGYLTNARTLYFSSDIGLLNLPFERLFEDGFLKGRSVLKVECARDFLFQSSEVPPAKGALVIGNPAYTVLEKETKPEDDNIRNTNLDLLEIAQLPFAELEARRVSARLRAPIYIGRNATKRRFLQMQDCGVLHISTHGSFDVTGETKELYSSFLVFAGAQDWANDRRTGAEYGNGIVTADEISRMDLRSTQLLVLSSCMNGRSAEIWGKGFQGMIGAFAAAGVKYVIANLWSMPDSLGTVIMMDAFYAYYASQMQEVPAALAKAKEYVRTINIGKMRRLGWFAFVKNSTLDEEYKKAVAELEALDDHYRPFKDEVFWGGLVCYRCNG